MSRVARWPALVLTAGLATRLRPLSTVRAKAALPVAGEALVCRILRRLRAAGVTRVVLNLHHQADSITREVGDGSACGLQVRYSWEPQALGSAGGPARALPLLESDRFLVVNGDTLVDVDLDRLAATHVASGALVTMVVVDGDPRYNGVIADAEGRVQWFGRAEGAAHFVGVQAVNAAAFAGVATGTPSETVGALYPSLIQRAPGSVRTYRVDGEFFDIGTPRDYLETAIRLAGREGKPLDIGRGSVVAPTARLDHTLVWNDAHIGDGAALTHCIVTDGVRVPAGSRYDHCSLVMTDHGLMAEPF